MNWGRSKQTRVELILGGKWKVKKTDGVELASTFACTISIDLKDLSLKLSICSDGGDPIPFGFRVCWTERERVKAQDIREWWKRERDRERGLHCESQAGISSGPHSSFEPQGWIGFSTYSICSAKTGASAPAYEKIYIFVYEWGSIRHKKKRPTSVSHIDDQCVVSCGSRFRFWSVLRM